MVRLAQTHHPWQRQPVEILEEEEEEEEERNHKKKRMQ
jgi:hypothetical protein